MAICSKCGKEQSWFEMHGPMFDKAKQQCKDCFFEGREDEFIGLDEINKRNIYELTKRVKKIEDANCVLSVGGNK